MKCPNCRNDLPASCLRCPYCNTPVTSYKGGARYTGNADTEPVYSGDPRYTNQGNYGNNSAQRRNYYGQGYQEYDYQGYQPYDCEPKRVTDINQILLSLGIVTIGMQIIVIMLLAALLLQL